MNSLLLSTTYLFPLYGWFLFCDFLMVVCCLVTGLQKQNQYFVKYKGLAHIHNGWVPERQLVLEAPLLVSKFNENNKVQ